MTQGDDLQNCSRERKVDIVELFRETVLLTERERYPRREGEKEISEKRERLFEREEYDSYRLSHRERYMDNSGSRRRNRKGGNAR